MTKASTQDRRSEKRAYEDTVTPEPVIVRVSLHALPVRGPAAIFYLVVELIMIKRKKNCDMLGKRSV